MKKEYPRKIKKRLKNMKGVYAKNKKILEKKYA
jgi:hypothetical protein